MLSYFLFFINIVVVIVVTAIIEIISKAMSTVTITDGKNESVVEELPDYSDLWQIQKFKEDDFWFMKVGQLSFFLSVPLIEYAFDC